MGGLQQDDLGAAGEALFARLCTLAPFVCNKSERDRTGWDYVVELPMPPPGTGLALDQRAPTAVIVQVKATSRLGPVSARLSSIERLAKDPRPAFVVVFRLRPDGEAVAGYLIHLIDADLARVLRRLRLAEAQGALAINKATISFDHHRVGRRFEPTGRGLRSAILEASGADPGAYLLEKQRQLSELGYEHGGLEAEALFRVESSDHLTKVLMGIEPLRPQEIRAYDTRFGIRIPYTGSALDDVEELVVEPPSLGRCQITVKGASMAAPAVFEGEMFAGPPLGLENGVWLLVKHGDFTLTFRETGMSFDTIGNFDIKPRTLDAWLPLVRALRYLAEGHGVVTLTGAFDETFRLELPINDKLTGPHLASLPALADFLEAWVRLIDLAGVKSDAAFCYDDIIEARGAHKAVDAMLCGGSRTRLAFDSAELGAPANPVEALYFNSCSLGDAAISFAARVMLSPNPARPGEFVSTGFAPVDVRAAVPGDLQDYGEERGQASSLRILISPENIIEVPMEDMPTIAP